MVETSNLAHKLATGLSNEKNAKLGQHGRQPDHVTYFLKFWNLSKTVSQTSRKQ